MWLEAPEGRARLDLGLVERGGLVGGRLGLLLLLSLFCQ